MKLRRLIKENARRALQRHWCRAAAIALVSLVFCFMFITLETLLSSIFGLPAFVDPFVTPDIYIDDLPNVSPVAMAVMGVVAMLYFAVIAPLQMGIARWFYLVGDGKAESAITIFHYFGSTTQFWKVLWLYINRFFRQLIWTVVFLSVPSVLIYFAQLWKLKGDTDMESVLSLGMFLAGGTLMILLGVFLAIWLMRYYLAEYIIIHDSTCSVSEAIRQSVLVSRGRCTELFVLEFTLLGWRFADLLILPRLFTLPYRLTIKGLYAHYLLEVTKRSRVNTESA